MLTTTTIIEQPPERAIHVTGSVRLVLVINLGSFVEPADAELFRHWRGSEAYAEAVRGLRPHAPFVFDAAHGQMEQEAYGLRIFRSRLIHNHFFPTYRVDMRLQWQGNKTNTLGITLGTIVGFMAISSFLADTFSVIDNVSAHQNVIVTIAVILVGLAVLALAVYMARRYSRRQGWQRHK